MDSHYFWIVINKALLQIKSYMQWVGLDVQEQVTFFGGKFIFLSGKIHILKIKRQRNALILSRAGALHLAKHYIFKCLDSLK